MRRRAIRGNLLFPTGRVDECHAEHALALQMAERAGDSEATARALGGLGDAEYLRGRMLTAGNYFRRSVEASVQAGLGRIEASNRPMAALATMFELRLADALQEALVAVERARLMTQPRAEGQARAVCAFVLAELGRDAEALRHVDEHRHDYRDHRLDPMGVRHADHRDLRDPREPVDRLLDLAARDVLAAVPVRWRSGSRRRPGSSRPC